MLENALGQAQPASRRIPGLVCRGHARTLRSRRPSTLIWWQKRVPGDTLRASASARRRPAGGAVRRVLLLNVTYEPLTTVGLRRAVCLVLGGKAEIVHHDTRGRVVHSAHAE